MLEKLFLENGVCEQKNPKKKKRARKKDYCVGSGNENGTTRGAGMELITATKDVSTHVLCGLRNA